MQCLLPFVVLFVSIVLRVNSFGTTHTSSAPRGLSPEAVVKLARRRFLDRDDDHCFSPMSGRVAVITGAAGGIGGELSKTVHRLGGTVIALDRNATGLEALQKTLVDSGVNTSSENDNNDEIRGGVLTIQTNHEDLSSVASAAELILSKFEKIDLLVNNAGMAYTPDRSPDAPMASAHGKDLSFTVNYLSHFLLTEKLAECLSDKGRVVHITSTYHWKVDGSELVPSPVDGIPVTYQSDPRKQHPNHIGRSYANTKLAQIWHSRSLVSVLPKGCSSVCACPLWAATGIAGESSRDTLSRYAFSITDGGPGITSAINAMFRTDEELGDALNDGKSFIANANIVQYGMGKALLASDIVKALGWRDNIGDLVGVFLLFAQKFAHEEFTIQRTSPESFQSKEDRDMFYQWSKDEVQPWL